jgi:hypothetical protein
MGETEMLFVGKCKWKFVDSILVDIANKLAGTCRVTCVTSAGDQGRNSHGSSANVGWITAKATLT